MNLRLIIRNVQSFIKIIFFAGIFFTYSSCQRKTQDTSRILNKTYKEPILEGREIIRDYLITTFTPGLSVSVSYNNEIIWSEGYGLASKELKVPASRDTKYRIGSTSQMFTAFAIAKLQEEGKLDINDSFYKYVPNFPKKQEEFTLKQLGVNSAGFGADDPTITLNKNNFKNLKDYISFYEDNPLAYKPGTRIYESAYSTSLLGVLAEEVSGTFYDKLVKTTILDTLKLNDTKIDIPFWIIDNRTEYYFNDYMARQVNAPYVDLRFMSPANGFLSTADDLNRAAQTLLKPGFFTQESIDLFFTPDTLKDGTPTNRGFCWWVMEEEERTAYVQLGSIIGGSSIITVYPKEKLVITACTNIQDENYEFPAKHIAELFIKHLGLE